MKISKVNCKDKECSFNFDGLCERSSVDLIADFDGNLVCNSADYTIAKKVKK